MYIKAWRNKKEFTGNAKPHCGRGRECPCFAVWAVVCDSLSKAELYPLSSAKANVGRFAGDCDKSFFAVWYPLMEVGDGCL